MSRTESPARAALLLKLRAGQDPAVAAADMASRKPAQRRYLSHDELVATYGATEEEIEAIRSFAAGYSLSVDEVHAAGRLLMLSGTMADFARAFHCEQAANGVYAVTPPAELA